MYDYDLAVRGGTLADDSGGALRSGEIVIKDGLIVAIDAVDDSGAEDIDAIDKPFTPVGTRIFLHPSTMA